MWLITLTSFDMRFKYILFLLFILAAAHLAASQRQGETSNTINKITATDDDDFIAYIVKAGDTAYSIAAAHGISLKELYKLNPEAEKGIRSGETLRIPRKIVGYTKHKVTGSETFYSISRQYGISVADLKSANKNLSDKNLPTGKEIRIPQYNGQAVIPSSEISVSHSGYGNPNIEHKVAKGETLYNIGKQYGVSIETLFAMNDGLGQGLKEGMTLQIPKKQVHDSQPGNIPVTSVKVEEPTKVQTDNTVRIAVLLPFAEDGTTVQQNKIIETYNGFLLAVKDLKKQGKDAEIYTFDIGSETNTKKLEGLLETNEMKGMSFIIGGISKQQIAVISKFAKNRNIPYLIPFDSKTTVADSNPMAYRMTTSPAMLYDKAIKSFIAKYKGQNIIIVSESGSDNNKSDFTTALKSALNKAGISFKTVGQNYDLATELKNASNTTGRNVLIPTSASDATLKRIFAAIDDSTESYTLFGYPEWQIYTNLYSQFYKYDTNIYSIFFLDENQSKVINLNNEYKSWYNRSIHNSYPKYAFLGYDMGLYFMSALNKFGKDMNTKIQNFDAPTLQSAIQFERESNKGGYVNTGLYFIHFKNNSTIEKTECK